MQDAIVHCTGAPHQFPHCPTPGTCNVPPDDSHSTKLATILTRNPAHNITAMLVWLMLVMLVEHKWGGSAHR